MTHRPRKPLSKRIASRLAVLGCALLIGAPVSATPTLQGDPATLFTVDPATDCAGCTAAELDTLQQGLSLALRRLKRESLNPQGLVCVAEASLVRDLAVLTYNELRLTGTISQTRWHDFLRAKAKISGGLSPITREMLLHTFGSFAADRLDVSAFQLAGALDLYASGSYSTVFRLMAEDRWDPAEWLTELQGPPAGTAQDGKAAQTHGLLNQAVVLSRPEAIWLQGQLGHLLSLPQDFETASVLAQVEALRLGYHSAIEGNFATVMRHGCGVESSAAMLEQLSAESATKREDRFQDDPDARIIKIPLAPGWVIEVNLDEGTIRVVREEGNSGAISGADEDGYGTTSIDDLEPTLDPPTLGPDTTGYEPDLPDVELPPGYGPPGSDDGGDGEGVGNSDPFNRFRCYREYWTTNSREQLPECDVPNPIDIVDIYEPEIVY